MFPDDIKLEGRSVHVFSIQLDFDRAVERTECKCLLQNATKSQHLNFGRKACPVLVFVNVNGILIFMPHAHHAKDFAGLSSRLLRFSTALCWLTSPSSAPFGN